MLYYLNDSDVAEVSPLLKSEKMQVIQQFEQFSDEELIEQVHLGNTDALDFLITKYRLFVKAKADPIF